ncbi:MAG: GNAT family N-acetyltransferase [Eggerthellaceae bacterium]|nr:GNAT family N-acetyltransferase [Eggerthellaceae bacterium]
MTLTFKPVSTDEDIALLACMAHDIWHEYWSGIIGDEQVEYMVETFQSETAIKNAIRVQGYEYWLLETKGCFVGYTGTHTESSPARLFISKLYLKAEDRGKGFASQTIQFFEELCTKRNLGSMYLTVNKYNELAKRAYLAKGFVIVDATVQDIGHGFVMDDYIMEKVLG